MVLKLPLNTTLLIWPALFKLFFFTLHIKQQHLNNQVLYLVMKVNDKLLKRNYLLHSIILTVQQILFVNEYKKYKRKKVFLTSQNLVVQTEHISFAQWRSALAEIFLIFCLVRKETRTKYRGFFSLMKLLVEVCIC